LDKFNSLALLSTALLLAGTLAHAVEPGVSLAAQSARRQRPGGDAGQGQAAPPALSVAGEKSTFPTPDTIRRLPSGSIAEVTRADENGRATDNFDRQVAPGRRTFDSKGDCNAADSGLR
jgi:hypothetical protein